MCKGVIDPPKARGDIVGEQHVNCIVAPCEEKEDDATESCEEGSPVQKNEPPG